KGYIRQMAAPTPYHQEISLELSTILRNHLKATKRNCKLYVAPFDVRLVKNPQGKTDKEIYTVVQPDLCLICDLSKIDQRGCLGSPDFIIEILSPSNSQTDLQDKFELYEENGVAEYWIVFPYEKVVQKFLLINEKYQFSGYYTINKPISPMALPDLLIDLGEVFVEEV
ncbi:MAG: Uma2 family endonuclease, partial [Thermoflexibacteraceae bacterium]